MSIQDLKIGAWKNPIVNEADRPNRAPADMKSVFDSNSNELRDAVNGVIDAVTLAAETIKNDLPSTQYLSGDGTYGVPEVGAAANGVPSGGTIGQVLVKKSGADFDMAWVGFGKVYNRTLVATDWADGKQTINVDITDDGIAEILPPLSDNVTNDELEALQEANLQDGGQDDGSITIVARGDVPKINVPIRVLVRGIC